MRSLLFALVFFGLVPHKNYSQPKLKIVGYYPFTGNAKDESGFNNNAVVHGATLTKDRFGNPNSAYYFNGVGDYIIVDQSNRLNNFPITISAWVKPELRQNIEVRYGNRGTAIQYPNNVISNDNPYNYGHGFGLNVWENGAQLTVQFNDGNEVMPLNTRGDRWYYVAISYNPGNFSLYVNGNFIQSKQYGQGQINGLNHILIGKHNDDLNGWENKIYFKGIIDEVTIYDLGLDADQIEELYQKSSTPPLPPKSPVTEALIQGRVLDKETLKPVKTSLTVIGDKSPMQSVPTSLDGQYAYKNPLNDISNVSITVDGYEPLRQNITVDKDQLTKNFLLIPKQQNNPAPTPSITINGQILRKGQSIVLDNIQFNQSKSDLLSEGKIGLDQVVRLLRQKSHSYH